MVSVGRDRRKTNGNVRELREDVSMEGTNPRVGRLIIQGVKEQIANVDPPEVGQTYDRLIAEGYPEEEVYEMLGCVLSTEMFEIMKHKRVFDRQLYVKRLRELPKLPWE